MRNTTIATLILCIAGGLFGGRDHSTVIHSCNKVEADMAGNADFRHRVEKLRDEFGRA